MANAYGTYTTLSSNANSLTNGSFAELGEIDFGAAPPHLCLLQLSLQASATPSGDKEVAVFVRASLDGTTFSDAGATANEANLHRVGTVSLEDTSAHVSRAFELASAFGGALPTKLKVLIKNSCGVPLAASAQQGRYRTETLG